MTNPYGLPVGFEQGPTVIRRLRSISSAQADVVVQELAAATKSWRAERHDDYDGYLSIIISSDKENAPTFAITGRSDQIELSEVQDDALHARGSFSSVAGATAAVVSLVRSASL